MSKVRQVNAKKAGPWRPIAMVVVAAGILLLLLRPLPLLGYSPQADAQDQPSWGELTETPVVISPPAEFIPTDAGPVAPPLWYFPRTSIDGVKQTFLAAGFSDEEAIQLLAEARPDARHGGFAVAPDPELVRAIKPQVRARLYRGLAASPLNFFQQAAYRFFGTSPDAWLGAGLAPGTRALVDPLIYRDGSFLFFADLELVRGRIGNGPELQRLLKRLLSQATVLVSLRATDASRLDSLVEYWGRGGRKTDIRPLLESIAGSRVNQSIDITHLLPETARRLLYRYPKVSVADLRKPQLANCFWTALNFFNDDPDDRLLDPEIALQELHRDYFLVQDALQLGDIVALSDDEMNIFHVAVYIADDLVFTKNGYFSLAPWTILPIDRLKGHFAERGDDYRVTYHRRRDLL